MDREAWRAVIHGLQRVGHDWATELNWILPNHVKLATDWQTFNRTTTFHQKKSFTSQSQSWILHLRVIADQKSQKAYSSSNKMLSSTAYYFYIPVWLKMKIFSVSNVRSVWLNLAIGLAPWNNKMLGTATVPNLVERLQERKPELTVGFPTQLRYQNGWKDMRKDQFPVTCGGFWHWSNRLWLFLTTFLMGHGWGHSHSALWLAF